jgi:hypothetical protein
MKYCQRPSEKLLAPTLYCWPSPPGVAEIEKLAVYMPCRPLIWYSAQATSVEVLCRTTVSPSTVAPAAWMNDAPG